MQGLGQGWGAGGTEGRVVDGEARGCGAQAAGFITVLMTKPSVQVPADSAPLPEGSARPLLGSVPLTVVTGHRVSGISSEKTFPDGPGLVPWPAWRPGSPRLCSFSRPGPGIAGQGGPTWARHRGRRKGGGEEDLAEE